MEAYIYETANASSFSETPLKIGGNNIGFIAQPLMDHCRFQSNAQNDWQLTFFERTKFEISLRVDFKTDDEKFNRPKLAQAKWVDGAIDLDKVIDPSAKEIISSISKFIRGSFTLQAEQYIETTNNRYIVADRNAIGYVGEDEKQFQRAVLCLALGVAYRAVLRDLIHKVTGATNSEDTAELVKLHRQILTFNAGNYFRYPVDLNSHELRIVWDTIHQNWCLQELNQELTNQLTAVAELLRTEQETRDAELKEQQAERAANKAEQDATREASFNRRATLVGVLLGVLSILTLVEITPKHFTDFASTWGESINSMVQTDVKAEVKK